MATYERSVRIRAPLETVWEFHSTEAGLVELTPGWAGLEVEATRGPDGEPDPAVLTEGSALELAVQPLGLGPRQRVVSEIDHRERGEGHAVFTDVMHDGPFEHWAHTHRFVADGEATVLTDSVEYELPLGALGRALGPLAVVGFEPMFRYRHRRTKALLE
jgi:ligand-binding SRPBCC domain-containing protein